MKQAPEILKVLWDEAAIQVRVRELGAQITRDYERNLSETLTRNPPIAVGLLRGAVIFLSDLIRAMPIPVECDFMQIASYGKDSKPGEGSTFSFTVPVAPTAPGRTGRPPS